MTAIHWILGGFLLYAYASFFWATNRPDAVMYLWMLTITAGCFLYGATLPSLRDILRGLAIGFSIDRKSVV